MPTKVIYVHGMGGSPEDWRQVQTRVSGLSLPISHEAGTPVEAGGKLADEVAKQVSGSFALCGYSMGGRISLLAAKDLLGRKKKPDAVILVSAGLGIVSEDERTLRNHKDAEWATLAETNPEEFWKNWYLQDVFATFQNLPEATRTTWIESRKALEISNLTAQLRHLGPGRHEPLDAVVKELVAKGVRVLYLAGELDKKYSDLAQRVKGIPGVSVDLVPGAGHVLPLEAPEALAMRIAKFIK